MQVRARDRISVLIALRWPSGKAVDCKPTGTGTTEVRFLSSAPLGAWCNGLALAVSKTVGLGSNPGAPASLIAEGSHNRYCSSLENCRASARESSNLSPSFGRGARRKAVGVRNWILGERRCRLMVGQRFAKSPGESLCRFESCHLRQAHASSTLRLAPCA
jgi:hypothetical protein